jgi:squalene monooxygenase
MTVAFWDVVTMTELLHPKNVPSFAQTDLVMAQLSEFHWKRKSHSMVINILAQALYEIFSAGDNPDMVVLREACFEYFRLGGICAAHPVGLLSGYVICGP